MSDRQPGDPVALLDQLAPDIDLPRAHSAFRRARTRRRAHRRIASAVLVAAGSLTVVATSFALTQDPDPQVTAGQPAGERGTVSDSVADRGSGMFALPSSGDADSVLLADGTPVWIVNHGDGTASAVPALFQASMHAPPLNEQLYSAVMWDRGDRVFEILARSSESPRSLSWDAHGRSLTGERDLVGFTAKVDGDRVSVNVDDTRDVPGNPLDVTRTSDGPRHRSPKLPPFADIDQLTAGWHQVDADILVDESGQASLCEPVPDDEPLAGIGQSPCPDDAPPVGRIDIGDLAAIRLLSPLVVRVNNHGTIDAVLATNTAGRPAN